MILKSHPVGARVRSIFKDMPDLRFQYRGPDGVVIDNVTEGERQATLIEFEEWDEDEGEFYTHQKWLPTRHWKVI